MSVLLDLIGQRFGNLQVLELSPERTNANKSRWVCQCDCGRKCIVIGAKLGSGWTKSCGCLHRKSSSKNIRKSHAKRKSATHCARGHEFTPENTYFQPNADSRTCIQCRKLNKGNLLWRLEKAGWTHEMYLKARADQRGLCAICHQPEKCKDGRALAADHEHSSKIPRALLCSNCNKGLGNFQDNPQLLLIAAQYLRRYQV